MNSYSSELLDRMRLTQDNNADAVMRAYDGDFGLLQQHLAHLVKNESTSVSDMKPKLKSLWQDLQAQRSGLSQDVLAKGFKFFDQHASDVMLLLGLLSLPYCYAAAKGAEVLVRSKYILENPEKRLLETAEFVFEVMRKDAFSMQGAGLVHILKVRLMHAMIRFRIDQSGHWNEKKLGKAINQEDMAGTNLSFSLIVIRGLRELGKEIAVDQAEDYINYWNQLGSLLGLEKDLLPESAKEAYILERNIRKRQFEPSEAGEKLFASLRNYFIKATAGSPIEGMTDAFMEKLLGEKVSQLLGLRISRLDKAALLPYTSFLKLKNSIGNQPDSYLTAMGQFKQQKSSLG